MLLENNQIFLKLLKSQIGTYSARVKHSTEFKKNNKQKGKIKWLVFISLIETSQNISLLKTGWHLINLSHLQHWADWW